MRSRSPPAPDAPRIGTAGWAIPATDRDAVGGTGTALARYAGALDAVEINSSFHRPHRRSTYARWADTVPPAFRFAVKVPKTITHGARLIATDALLDEFIAECDGLGAKLGVLLVQLPPSLAFDEAVTTAFFAALRARSAAVIACEPRHPSWFAADADRFLAAERVARVAADPPVAPGGDRPGGWPGLVYHRLHGSPQMYRSAYAPAALDVLAAALRDATTPAWCMFDNTAAGAALGDALALRDRLGVGAPAQVTALSLDSRADPREAPAQPTMGRDRPR